MYSHSEAYAFCTSRWRKDPFTFLRHLETTVKNVLKTISFSEMVVQGLNTGLAPQGALNPVITFCIPHSERLSSTTVDASKKRPLDESPSATCLTAGPKMREQQNGNPPVHRGNSIPKGFRPNRYLDPAARLTADIHNQL